MSDDLIFREVDEELRQEQVKQIWQRYGTYIIAVAALIVVGVAGYKGWTWYKADRAAESGARFEQALRLVGDGKTDQARALLGDIAANGSGGYPLLARFAAAAAEAEAGNRQAAVDTYDALAQDAGDPVLRDLARVQAAALIVDTAPYETVAARLNGIDADANVWRNSARELLGLSAYRAGDMDKAATAFEAILADPVAQEETRGRAELMLTLVTQQRAPREAGGPAQTPAAGNGQ